MSVFYVEVGVALRRPPRIDEYRLYAVEAGSRYEAELVATQMASCTCTMPLSSEISYDYGPRGAR